MSKPAAHRGHAMHAEDFANRQWMLGLGGLRTAEKFKGIAAK
jgi:hypothetical protein